MLAYQEILKELAEGNPPRKAKILKVTEDGLVKYKLFDKKEKELLRTSIMDGVADFDVEKSTKVFIINMDYDCD